MAADDMMIAMRVHVELIERLAALIPLPRVHRHGDQGVLALNARQRGLIMRRHDRCFGVREAIWRKHPNLRRIQRRLSGHECGIADDRKWPFSEIRERLLLGKRLAATSRSLSVPQVCIQSGSVRRVEAN